MRAGRALCGALVLSLLLTGCAAGTPRDRLQERANAVVEAANAGDAAALRTAAGLLLREVDRQEGQADLAADTAQALRVLANRILANAGLLEAAPPSAPPAPAPPSAAPAPSPEPTSAPPSAPAEPSRSPSPAPSSPPPQPLPSLGVGTSPSPSSS